MGRYKKYSILVFSLAILPVVGVMAFNLLMDPLQIYHDPILFQGRYWHNARYQNAGLINRYLYRGENHDAVIIGTSLMECMIPSRINATFGWSGTLNLAMSGSRPLEQNAVLRYALRSGKVKHVLWGINPLAYVFNDKSVWWEPRYSFQEFLYNRNRFDDFCYLGSLDMVQYGCDILADPKFWRNDLDSLYAWPIAMRAEFAEYNQPENLDRLRAKIAEAEAGQDWTAPPLETVYDTVDQVVTPLVREYPDVEFILFLPPYSRQWYAQQEDVGIIRWWLGLQGYLAKALDGLPNARFFCYDTDPSVAPNLANYKDPYHFNPGAAEDMAARMARGEGRLTSQNADEHVAALTELVRTYATQSDPSTAYSNPAWAYNPYRTGKDAEDTP